MLRTLQNFLLFLVHCTAAALESVPLPNQHFLHLMGQREPEEKLIFATVFLPDGEGFAHLGNSQVHNEE